MEEENKPALENRVKHFLIELLPCGSLYNTTKEVDRNDKKIVSKYLTSSALDGVKAILYLTPILYYLS